MASHQKELPTIIYGSLFLKSESCMFIESTINFWLLKNCIFANIIIISKYYETKFISLFNHGQISSIYEDANTQNSGDNSSTNSSKYDVLIHRGVKNLETQVWAKLEQGRGPTGRGMYLCLFTKPFSKRLHDYT